MEWIAGVKPGNDGDWAQLPKSNNIGEFGKSPTKPVDGRG
jgi:hypothetical protein